jgi:peptidoglycan/LPS O-acetylase OafA/YrhL
MRPQSHFNVLDGWRGVSILLVLATHLLPLGPKSWHVNHASGVLGMAIFFVLSGFLITTVLLKNVTVTDFLARRIFRIVPLAWLYLAVALTVAGASADSWMAHYLFYANLPPKHLVHVTDHLWSVCVEMQFYAGIAFLVALLGVRGLLLVPLLCLGFTALRVVNGVPLSTISYYRVDEILAGSTLALIYHGRMGEWLRQRIAALPLWPLLALLCLSCLKQSDWVNYFRPYLAAATVGVTLLNARTALSAALNSRLLAYIAGISYALYVIHPILAASWLGSGGLLEKYAKRPLLFVVLFALAHLSTYYYERRWIAFGKKLGSAFRPMPPIAGAQRRDPP